MTTIPNPPSTGDEFTNELTGVTYRYNGSRWVTVSGPIDDAVEDLTNQLDTKVDKAGDTMTGRLNAPRIAVDGTTLASGRVFEAKFQGETNA